MRERGRTGRYHCQRLEGVLVEHGELVRPLVGRVDLARAVWNGDADRTLADRGDVEDLAGGGIEGGESVLAEVEAFDCEVGAARTRIFAGGWATAAATTSSGSRINVEARTALCIGDLLSSGGGEGRQELASRADTQLSVDT